MYRNIIAAFVIGKRC